MRYAAIALAVLIPNLVSAQVITCTETNESPRIRAEGVAELAGDIVLECTQSGPGAAQNPYLNANVQVFFSSAVTNALISKQDPSLADAVLIINENNATPTSASTLGGPQGTVPVPQFAHAVGNELFWNNVQIPIPGATLPGGAHFPDPITIRMTNMRFNASEFGAGPNNSPGDVFIYSIAFSDGAVLPGGSNSLSVGRIYPGLQTAVRNTITALPQCQSLNVNGGVLTGNPAFYVAVKEGFPNAFLPLGTPSATPSEPRAVESGYPTGGFGGATQGTRFQLVLNNIPAGVRLGVRRKLHLQETAVDRKIPDGTAARHWFCLILGSASNARAK